MPNPSSPSSSNRQMDRQLLEACNEGDLELLKALIRDDSTIVTSTTPDGNNCLHLTAMLRTNDDPNILTFAQEIWSTDPSLLSGTNIDGETPLVAALAAGNATLASGMITAAMQLLQPDMERGKPLNEILLEFDTRGNSALHHAVQNGFEDLAVQLLDIEPGLSKQVSNSSESPMHMTARKGYSKVLEKLIKTPSSAVSGPLGFTALNAAVDARRTDIVKQLLKGLPHLAYHNSPMSPLGTAVDNGNLELVKIFLEHDPDLAYLRNGNGPNAFLLAAYKGSVPIAQEILAACPDSAFSTNIKTGYNALHAAVLNEQMDFVDFILRTPKLHRLINQADYDGHLALHIAATMCNPGLLRLLLFHKRQDCTALTPKNYNVVSIIQTIAKTDLIKTLKWNESYTLALNIIPVNWRTKDTEKIKKDIKGQAIKEIKSLTARYTSNTSLVAALLATITFAAAFTLPGGYGSDATDAGQPIFGMKAAFQVFLISDTIAMCSSLAVTFLCVLATWEDLDFLLNYRKTTRALMWCAYVATVVAFGTGLFTVIAPKNMWLAILVVVLSSILPFVSKIIGEWPLLMLRLRLGHLYRKDLIPNI